MEQLTLRGPQRPSTTPGSASAAPGAPSQPGSALQPASSLTAMELAEEQLMRVLWGREVPVGVH